MAGPSHFVDVDEVYYGSQRIYSVSGIRLSFAVGRIFGQDNNHLRPVSSHIVSAGETCTVSTSDINALIEINEDRFAAGAYPLTFKWKPASEQLNGSALPMQLVTIQNLVLVNVDMGPAMKGIGDGSINLSVLDDEYSSDPVSFTNAS